jgi:hypothetical protein
MSIPYAAGSTSENKIDADERLLLTSREEIKRVHQGLAALEVNLKTPGHLGGHTVSCVGIATKYPTPVVLDRGGDGFYRWEYVATGIKPALSTSVKTTYGSHNYRQELSFLLAFEEAREYRTTPLMLAACIESVERNRQALLTAINHIRPMS